jgi:hypothetical protein
MLKVIKNKIIILFYLTLGEKYGKGDSFLHVGDKA